MGSPVRALRATVLAFAITGAASCGGDLVRLGDGPTAGGAGAGGSAGMGAVASQTGIGGTSGNAGTAGGEDGGQTEGGSGGTDSCLRGEVTPEEVLWIGDSWILLPGTQTRRVRDLARAAGSLAPDQDYVNRASSTSPQLSAIVNAYETRQAGMTKVKVLLMNGGTWDTIIANGSPASVMAVATELRAFLAQVASDGTVEHVVYFLQPELPTIDGVAALRPLLVAACDESTVPCHFLDLQPFWLGHPEYTDASMIQASEAGATVIADEIWKIMQDNCIAQ